jgi:hypothetical protein
MKRALLLAIAPLLLAITCGPSTPANDGGTADALLGTWVGGNAQSGSFTLVMRAGMTYTLTFAITHPNDGEPGGGCTETIVDNGSYTTTATELTFNADLATSGTATYTGCADPSENGSEPGDPFIDANPTGYTLSGNTLTVGTTGTDPITLTRQ